MKQLERIAERYALGELDSRQAAFCIVSLVSQNKFYFKVNDLSREEFDNFMLKELPHIEHILETFDARRANFSTFFYKSFHTAAHTYKRRLVTRLASEESMHYMDDILYEEQEYRYAQDEGELCVEAASVEEEFRYWASRPERKRRSCLMNTMQKKHYHSADDEKIEDLRRSACLILFLKSSAVVDDSSVRSTSIVTGLSEEKLFAMKEELKEKIEKKMGRRQNARDARDLAFFLRRRYIVQYGMYNDTSMRQKIREGFKYQSKHWKRNILRLENAISIAPSNKDIGRILNISEMKVAGILKLARKKIDEICVRL